MKFIAFLIVVIFGICCTFYSFFYGKIHHKLDYDNEKHFVRFLLFFLLFLCVSIGLAFVPVTIWPIPVMAVCIMLFSNQVTGILCAGLFTTISVMASGQSVYTFALYFLVSIVTVLVFYGIDESVKMGFPLFISLSAIAVVEMTFLFLSGGTTVSLDFLSLAIANLVLCGLLLVIVLKVFYTSVIFKDRDYFLSINDTEYPVMKQAKEKNKDVYMHAVHTAYLCDKLATALDIQAPEIKTAAYYHRIGEAFMEHPEEAYYEKLCEENKFPPAATALVLECSKTSGEVHSLESCIVSIADAMISSIVYMFHRDPDLKPDYETIIQRLINQKIEQGMFLTADVTYRQVSIIQKTLLKETLYYDFLR